MYLEQKKGEFTPTQLHVPEGIISGMGWEGKDGG